MAKYLFIHFTMDSNKDEETIWFSLSQDGLHWQDIGKEPIIKSNVGTKGIRDPFMVYDEKQGKYFIVATDLNTNAEGYDWGKGSSAGSRSILTWESKDLINWSDNRIIEIAVANAGCLWAPEAVYCKEKGSWFVFWASNVKEASESNSKQRIYGAFTNDFINFTPTFKYIEKEMDIIDTDIIFDNGWYYRFSKDETNKCIIIERAKTLLANDFERVHSKVLDNEYGFEGPLAYYLEDKKKWCLLVDQYRISGGYLPLVTDDLENGSFEVLDKTEYDLGTRKKRHGGIITISDEEYDRLINHFGKYNS